MSDPSLLRRSAMSAQRICTGIGHRPAPHPAVQRLVAGTCTSTSTWQMPAELVGQRGDAGVEVGGVGEHDEVRRPACPCTCPGTAQVLGADLLLALDDELHVAGEPAAATSGRGHRGDVGHAPALVVGGAAAVEPAAALRGLEGRASSTSPGGPGAGRRDGRRGGSWARPAGAASPRRRRGGRRGSRGPRRSPRRPRAGRRPSPRAERRTSSAREALGGDARDARQLDEGRA